MAMHLEGQAKTSYFLSNRLSESIGNLTKVTAYFQSDASLADKGKNRCSFTSSIIKPNELVLKVEKCGHVYCADNYIRQMAVRVDSNTIRQATSAFNAILRSTSLTSPSMTWMW